MAKAKNNNAAQNGGIVEQPDFDKAKRILLQDVHPASEKVGVHAQEMSTAFRAIKKHCHVNTAAAKLVWNLKQMSEEKRDDFLRSFKGMSVAFGIGITADLVDQAEGNEPSAGDFIPPAKAQPLELATVN